MVFWWTKKNRIGRGAAEFGTTFFDTTFLKYWPMAGHSLWCNVSKWLSNSTAVFEKCIKKQMVVLPPSPVLPAVEVSAREVPPYFGLCLLLPPESRFDHRKKKIVDHMHVYWKVKLWRKILLKNDTIAVEGIERTPVFRIQIYLDHSKALLPWTCTNTIIGRK